MDSSDFDESDEERHHLKHKRAPSHELQSSVGQLKKEIMELVKIPGAASSVDPIMASLDKVLDEFYLVQNSFMGTYDIQGLKTQASGEFDGSPYSMMKSARKLAESIAVTDIPSDDLDSDDEDDEGDDISDDDDHDDGLSKRGTVSNDELIGLLEAAKSMVRVTTEEQTPVEELGLDALVSFFFFFSFVHSYPLIDIPSHSKRRNNKVLLNLAHELAKLMKREDLIYREDVVSLSFFLSFFLPSFFSTPVLRL